MSSPFIAPVRRVAHAPGWVVALVATVAIVATALVAGHRYTGPDATHEAPATNETVVTTHRGPSVSRGVVDRTAHARVLDARTLERKPPRPQEPLASSNAAETAASAVSSTVNVPGHCLEWSREQAGIPSRYLDAATAWQHATGRQPADPDPPRGAAVYWTGGSNGYGHVAISLGHGLVRSSDAGGYGQVATVSIRRITAEWGELQYAGWANSINGYRIPGVPAS
ncbi:MAG TPA: hypothetical protein VFT70_08015 [Nocardioides sp.]|nr:hypothetical protein [Nocardioides sp.]